MACRWREGKNGRSVQITIHHKGKAVAHDTRPTMKLAKARELELKNELRLGLLTNKRGCPRFEDAAKPFLKRCKERTQGLNQTMKETTLDGYERDLRVHILPRLGRERLSEITPILVNSIVQDWLKTTAVTSVANRVNVISCVFDHAVETGAYPHNPIKYKIKLPARKLRGEDEIPSYEDFRKLLAFLYGTMPLGYPGGKVAWAETLAIAGLTGLAGLRIGECRGLKFEDIDLDRRVLRIERQFNRHDKISPPKYGSRRRVPIGPVLLKIVTDYAALAGRSAGFLFIGPRVKQPPHGRWGWLRLRVAQIAAGIVDDAGEPRYSPHLLRHYAGSAWLAEGMRLPDVSRCLGHKDTQTTWRIYMHQLEEDTHAKSIVADQSAMYPGIPFTPAVPMLEAVTVEGDDVGFSGPMRDKNATSGPGPLENG